MEIKLNSWDINEAIGDYIKKKHNLEIDFKEMHDYPCFKYSERKVVYKRHRNGKIKKHKDGYYLIDEKQTKYVTKYANVSEEASINLYLD